MPKTVVLSANAFTHTWRRHFPSIKTFVNTYGVGEHWVRMWEAGRVPVPYFISEDLKAKDRAARPPSYRARSRRGRWPEYSVATPLGKFATVHDASAILGISAATIYSRVRNKADGWFWIPLDLSLEHIAPPKFDAENHAFIEALIADIQAKIENNS